MKREIPALDGIRGLAIALVVWSHVPGAPYLLSLFSGFGAFGVELFFALSGFLLFLPYGRALAHTTAWPSVKRFYRQRARRILPMYALVLLGIVLTLLHDGILRTQIVPLSFVALFFHDMRLDAWSLMSGSSICCSP